MNYEKAISELAPCGIDCSRCVSYKNGDVVRLSAELKTALTNFEHMAEGMKHFNPIFNSYPEFLTLLDYFSKGQCDGCRCTTEPSKGCSIRACHKAENVNFCAECKKFPCHPKTYNPRLAQTWLENNQRILEDGIDTFYEAQKTKPRY